MKVKALKEFLEQYDDNDEIEFICDDYDKTNDTAKAYLKDVNDIYFKLDGDAPLFIY